ncbi:hypothetical protein CBOM_05405 [Ceraceosorus bombacis]|uniref:Uncharacterized protein n=1 Tax=Ceraceosorus bombacis TaxID=401625 RepID=A0A0P1BQF7_9BASI|nr:hypothetical protein CBOM_05405 [Ceraceosorus bombacis]
MTATTSQVFSFICWILLLLPLLATAEMLRPRETGQANVTSTMYVAPPVYSPSSTASSIDPTRPSLDTDASAPRSGFMSLAFVDADIVFVSLSRLRGHWADSLVGVMHPALKASGKNAPL